MMIKTERKKSGLCEFRIFRFDASVICLSLETLSGKGLSETEIRHAVESIGHDSVGHYIMETGTYGSKYLIDQAGVIVKGEEIKSSLQQRSTLSQRQEFMSDVISQSTVKPLYQSESLNWLPVYNWIDNILGKDELIHVSFTPQDHDWGITALVHLTVKCKDDHTFTDTRGLFQWVSV